MSFRAFVSVVLLSTLGRAETQHAFKPEKVDAIKATIESAIAHGEAPGAVFHMERKDGAVSFVLGKASVLPEPTDLREDAVFDAASLTKVIATTPCIMHLVEQGKVDLNKPVQNYLPEFTGEGREKITVRHLLTHTSGLPAGLPQDPAWSGYDHAIEIATACIPSPPPDTVFRYSDVNFILLGEVVRRISGRTLPECANEWIYAPLKMEATTFRPSGTILARAIPTEKDENGIMLRGVVHDPTARRMGGVAGHAGLFTSMPDLARFARMLLAEGELDGARIFKAETVRLMTGVQTAATIWERRGLGWDIDSRYSRPRGTLFPIGGFGHTGWTGTSLWIDPFSRTFWIMLTSRLHPDGVGNVRDLQEQVGTLVAESVTGFDFIHVPGSLKPRQDSTIPSILNGIDIAQRDGLPELKGLRLGLITNQTGINQDRRSTIDILMAVQGVKLTSLFSPEHGIRGALDTDKIDDSRDAKTGLPVFSLYGERRAPTAEQLSKVDALVFDIQDIGCRFYTYVSTMKECMEAAAKAGKKFVVLDRVNPLGGLLIEGPAIVKKKDFTACHDIPVRHGMTVGELAQMIKGESLPSLDLHIVKCEGWHRDIWFDATSLPWVNPSPNMRSLVAATLYPGIGLLEFAISVGRGTDTPFEVIGAPYVEDRKLAWELNRIGLPGVRFVPDRFTPKASVFQGEACGGVRILVTNREALRPLATGLAIGSTLHKLYGPKFNLERFDKLMRDENAIDGIKNGQPWTSTVERWEAECAKFEERRKAFLLYE